KNCRRRAGTDALGSGRDAVARAALKIFSRSRGRMPLSTSALFRRSAAVDDKRANSSRQLPQTAAWASTSFFSHSESSSSKYELKRGSKWSQGFSSGGGFFAVGF